MSYVGLPCSHCLRIDPIEARIVGARRDGAKSSEEIWRSIHGGLSMHSGGGLASGAWAAPTEDVLTSKQCVAAPSHPSSCVTQPLRLARFARCIALSRLHWRPEASHM